MMKLENTTLPIELQTTGVRSSLSRLRTSIQGWIRRHIIADDPSPELSYLDQMDRIGRPNGGEPSRAVAEETAAGCRCSPFRSTATRSSSGSAKFPAAPAVVGRLL